MMPTLLDASYTTLAQNLSKDLQDYMVTIRNELGTAPDVTEGMVQTDYGDDPIVCQQNQQSTPRMWVCHAWAEDILDTQDADIGLMSRVVEQPHKGAHQALVAYDDLTTIKPALHPVAWSRGVILALAVLANVIQRQKENNLAISRKIFEYTPSKDGTTLGFYIEFLRNSENNLTMRVGYRSIFYAWGFWQRLGNGGRESGLAIPVEEETPIWSLPEGPKLPPKRR